MGRGVAAVLFDLDGTLVDSAPDLGAAVNEMRRSRGLTPLAHELLRPHGGSGARGMLGAAFGTVPGDPGYEAMRVEFLALYEARLLQATRLFAEVSRVLDALDRVGMAWGIVTNKALRYAEPVAAGLALWPRAAALVGGDSTPHAKPHPAPLLEAARRLDRAPADCVYVGDDPRDMRAGRAAGMRTLAAAWGYLGTEAPPDEWAADAVLARPDALLHWLELA